MFSSLKILSLVSILLYFGNIPRNEFCIFIFVAKPKPDSQKTKSIDLFFSENYLYECSINMLSLMFGICVMFSA